MNELTLEDLLKKVSEYNIKDLDTIKKAYDVADYLHDGQLRQSGEKYIIHPLNVAYTLAELHADTDTICAGLLHDTLEDTNVTREEIKELFNTNVLILVEGVTKISKMEFSNKQDLHDANTRKLIMGLMDDVRIIIIKLADRLHNMRTLQYKKPYKQIENANETLQIYVPLAYYMGLYRIKCELEDLSLKYAKPDKYKEALDKRIELENNSKRILQEMLLNIQKILNERNIPSEIKIRLMNTYGIYKRLKNGEKTDEIHDLLTLKIMVDTIANCYQTLGIVHSKYNPLNEKFKDYIYNPKINMYKSIHTTVFAPDDRLVQAQIRTFAMDKVASFGLANCWMSNLSDANQAMQEELMKRFEIYKSLVYISYDSKDDKDFVELVRKEIFASKIFVYTPKGERIELPKGSSVIDFAYKIHTDIGNNMVDAIVNGKSVPFSNQLENNSRIKIIANELYSEGPKETWLDFVKTEKAKRCILEKINK